MKWIVSRVFAVIVGVFIVYQILMFLAEQIGDFLPPWIKRSITTIISGISNAIMPIVGPGIINNLLTMIIFIAILGVIVKALTSSKS